MARYLSLLTESDGAILCEVGMDVEIRGDEQGVKACEECRVVRPEDFTDVVEAALNFGRAFLRQTVGKNYKIWELTPAGEAAGRPAPGGSPARAVCEVTLFAGGSTPEVNEETK
nr:hypothetical protein [Bacillota bacterium]